MIDNNKIKSAAQGYCDATYGTLNTNPFIAEAFRKGANWAINEFLKDLWHPNTEEPKHDKQITYVRINGIAKTIILNEEADKYNNTPSQIWHNICKNYKVACWFYIDDLLSKEGDNHD